MTAVRLAATIAVLCAGACGEADPVTRLACATHSQCPSGWHCAPDGICRADQPCTDDDHCCIAERCLAGHCRPRQACSSSVGCLDPDDICTHGMCAARPCDGRGSPPCGKGRSCLWGRCFAATPCGGWCAAGQACAAILDKCVAAPGAACPTGELAVVGNETERMPEGCAAHPAQIVCRALPPLPAGDRGMPGQLLALPGELVHASYDRTYGDVVLARHLAAPPFGLKSLRAVAGLPADAPVVGDPAGPRQGIAAPGPDFGRRLAALARKGGDIDLAFRDDTGDGVRFARVSGPSAAVASHVVAAGNGIGESLALALAPGGEPVVVAFSPEAPQASPPRSAKVFVFAAKTATPTASGDWVATELDGETVPTPPAPCGGNCPAGQACVAGPAGNAACATIGPGCKGCLPGQVCVAGSCAQVHVPTPPLDRGPRGRGASLDLRLLTDGTLAVAAYSAHAGDLHTYRRVAGNWQKAPVPRTSVAGGPKDFGRFVKIVPGDAGALWLACEDGEHGRLLVIRQTDKGWQGDVVDDGARPDGLHRVGADVAAVRHPFGGLLIAHQDTRRADLLLQRVPKPGVVGGRAVAEATDMAGFSPDLVQLGTKAWVLSAATLRLGADGRLQTAVSFRDLVWNGD
ncbi:MAG: hypothetical protein FJ100_03620 [Deltaproteobacteria bacterium]|nr:hypothetical protein [Deltaproteobacteria bacterium]